MSVRFPNIAPGTMTPEQRTIADAIAGGPRGGLRGPFLPLLYNPSLMQKLADLGEHLRFKTKFPPALLEFAIIMTARKWTAQYEWYAHRELAMKAGLAPAIADAIAERKRPSGMKDDEAAVYDFCFELHEKKSVGDAAYASALKLFGEQGVIDLIGASGYYTMVSMILNVDRHPLPEGVTPLAP